MRNSDRAISKRLPEPRRWSMCAVIGVMFLISLVSPFAPVKTGRPARRLPLSWSSDQANRREMSEPYALLAGEQLGGEQQISRVEQPDSEGHELWLRALRALQATRSWLGAPMVSVTRMTLVGASEIPDKLPELIGQAPASDDCDDATLRALTDAVDVTPTPNADLTLTVKACRACDEDIIVGTSDSAVHVVLFHDRLCEECVVVEEQVLASLKEAYESRLTVERRDVEGSADNYTLLRRLERRSSLLPPARLPSVRQGASGPEKPPAALSATRDPRLRCPGGGPAVRVAGRAGRRARGGAAHRPRRLLGEAALMGEELHADNLEALVARHADVGAEPAWKDGASSRTAAASGIIERFRSFSISTVLVAGLVDGLNPCAFATLVFFISYLALVGRGGREVLMAGIAFAAGVFVTYLGVGFGMLRILAILPFLDAASRWLYGLTAVLCLLLAVGSLHDWWQARRGRATEMHLKMPNRLRRWVNRTIREGARARAFVPVTITTGAVVSVIELACTGQVYLPTILFVLGIPQMQVRAGLYLVLYNLMFILPLVVVFLLAHFGTTSRQLSLLFHRHLAKIKLATAALFVVLAGWMLATLV